MQYLKWCQAVKHMSVFDVPLFVSVFHLSMTALKCNVQVSVLLSPG